MTLIHRPGGLTGGYVVEASGLFGGTSSDYLSRTFAGDDGDTWSFSMWFKLGKSGTNSVVFLGRASSNSSIVYRGSTDQKILLNDDGAATYTTTEVLRDFSGWHHLLIIGNGTSNTVKINGVALTLSGTSNIGDINAAVQHQIGYAEAYGSAAFYACEVAFCSTTAYDHTDFTIDDGYGNLVPKSLSGLTFGANGSWVKDPSTGIDSSGNGNDWAVNGTIAQVCDSPTDNVARGVGNLATFDPLLGLADIAGLTGTLTDGNRDWQSEGSDAGAVGTTLCVETGKWYVEFEVQAGTTDYVADIGVADAANQGQSSYANWRAGGTTLYRQFGPIVEDNSTVETVNTYTGGDVIGIEFDADAGTVQFYKNGSAEGTAASVSWSGPTRFVVGDDTNTSTVNVKILTDAADFNYAPSSGFKALATQNLPESTKNIDDYIQIVTDTEANIAATLAAARSGWSGYVDILKNRDSVESWAWRFSHDTSNEYFNNGSSQFEEQTNRTLAGADNWLGISIRIGAAYGTAAGAVAHTNGVATTVTLDASMDLTDSFIILFREGASNPPVHHSALTSGNLLRLATTAAATADTSITNVSGNSFDVDSSLASDTYDFLVLTQNDVIRVFEYTGNGNSDGPVPYLNGAAAAAIIKRSDNTTGANWYLINTATQPTNPIGQHLLMEGSVAEASGTFIDWLATGLKMRNTGNGYNGSGATYIGVAFVNPLNPKGRGQARGVPN